MKIRAYQLTSATTLFMLLVYASSCVDHKLPEPDKFSCSSLGQVSFATAVKPIIDSKCAIVGDGGCHNGGNGPTLDWRVFSNLQSHAASTKNRITRTPGTSGHMPKNGSMSEDEIRTMVCWVDQGAQNN